MIFKMRARAFFEALYHGREFCRLPRPAFRSSEGAAAFIFPMLSPREG